MWDLGNNIFISPIEDDGLSLLFLFLLACPQAGLRGRLPTPPSAFPKKKKQKEKEKRNEEKIKAVLLFMWEKDMAA